MGQTSSHQIIEGSLNAEAKKFAIVVSRWHHTISEKLVSAAIETLERYGANSADIAVVRVPGSFEIPCAAQAIAESGSVNAIIALGVLIKGDTDHYDLIAREVAQGCSFISTQFRIPVSFGVLTVQRVEDAEARAGGKHGNKGDEAAKAAIEMANLLEQLAGANDSGSCCGHCHG